MLEKLPENLKAEVLEFVEYLLDKNSDIDDDDWTIFAISNALRGMEDEDHDYTIADIKEKV